MAPRHSWARRLAYRILYSAIYFITLALLLVTPADIIDQALRNGDRARQIYIIWVVAVCCVLTVAALSFIYALRLYGSRSALAAIPKARVPIARGDVEERVYKLISAGLERSAGIAWRARPRHVSSASSSSRSRSRGGEGDGGEGGGGGGSRGGGAEEGLGIGNGAATTATTTDEATTTTAPGSRAGDEDRAGGGGSFAIPMPADPAVWGDIEHCGWTSPNATEFPPLLQYETVISELPALTEARALTLAPRNDAGPGMPHPHPASGSVTSLQDQQQERPVIGPAALDLLHRRASLSLRDYIGHLASLGIIVQGPTTQAFVALYEQARFSTRPISGAEFRELMRLFADLLKEMRPLDPGVISALEDDDEAGANRLDSDSDGGDADDDQGYSGDIDNHVSRSRHLLRSRSPVLSLGSGRRPPVTRASSFGSVRTRDPPTTAPLPPHLQRARTAPRLATSPSRSRSINSLGRAGRAAPYATSIGSRSGASTRSDATTSTSSSQGAGSVIRLALEGEDTGGLPFLIIGGSRDSFGSGRS